MAGSTNGFYRGGYGAPDPSHQDLDDDPYDIFPQPKGSGFGEYAYEARHTHHVHHEEEKESCLTKCCVWVGRIILTICATIVFVMGTLIFIVALYSRLGDEKSYKANEALAATSGINLNILLIVVTIIGAFIMMAAISGCCGAWRDKAGKLKCYIVFSAILGLICLIGGIYVFIYQKSIAANITRSTNHICQDVTATRHEMKCGPPPTTTPPPPANARVVDVSTTIQNMDFSKLSSQDQAVLSTGISSNVATKADVDQGRVGVSLSAGSVKVAIKITTNEANSTKIQDTLSDAAMSTLVQEAVTSLETSNPGIKAAQSGAISIGNSVVKLECDAKAPCPAKQSCNKDKICEEACMYIKYQKKWPHCANIKCVSKKPGVALSAAQDTCLGDAACDGMSFSTGEATGTLCYKKDCDPETGGYGTKTHDYWVKGACSETTTTTTTSTATEQVMRRLELAEEALPEEDDLEDDLEDGVATREGFSVADLTTLALIAGASAPVDVSRRQEAGQLRNLAAGATTAGPKLKIVSPDITTRAQFINGLGGTDIGCDVLNKICVTPAGFDPANACVCKLPPGDLTGGSYCRDWDQSGTKWCWVADGIQCGGSAPAKLEALPGIDPVNTLRSSGPCTDDVSARSDMVATALKNINSGAIGLIAAAVLILFSVCIANMEAKRIQRLAAQDEGSGSEGPE